MKIETIKHEILKKNFAEHDFRNTAERLSIGIRQEPNVKSCKYLGIDPHPKEGDYVEVWFIYKIDYD